MAKLYGLNERDRTLVKEVTRRVRAGSTSHKTHKRKRGPFGGGESRSIGTAAALGVVVSDIPSASLPDLTGAEVKDWSFEVGQEGPPSDRSQEFGESGSIPTEWTEKTGVLLVDWAREYDKSDPCSYFEAEYIEPKVNLEPIIEAFDRQGHIGGGLGGTEGEGTGAGGTFGGDGI